MLRAGIDIGTNTILLLIAEVQDGRVVRVLEDHVRVVRLGQAVDKNRAFHPDALDRARKCFAEYAAILDRYPRIDVQAVATSGSRDAKNSGEFFAEIENKYRIPVRVISGEEEALLSFQGALSGESSPAGSMAVLDIGGGSTEIVGQSRSSEKELFRYSFDMGCVRLTERFLPSDPPVGSQIQELESFVKSELNKQAGLLQGVSEKELVGVAGTATYLASSALGLSKFDPEKVHGAVLSLENIETLVQKFSQLKAEERLGIGGMDKGRADVIVAGALILKHVLKAAGLEKLRVSTRGLRYGAILSGSFTTR